MSSRFAWLKIRIYYCLIRYVVALKGGTKRDTAEPQAKRYSNVPPSRAARDENIFFLFFSAINNDDTYVVIGENGRTSGQYDVPNFHDGKQNWNFQYIAPDMWNIHHLGLCKVHTMYVPSLPAPVRD